MPETPRPDLTQAASSAEGESAARSTQRPPNILFILADQWRFSALGMASDEGIRTPHLDQLAKEGVNFDRAYALNPSCTPNRSCLLTGRYSHQHGMIFNNVTLPPSEVCWPEQLRDAGYATHYVGKWHMDGPDIPGFVPPGWRRRGFTTFEGFNRGHVYYEPWGFDDEGRLLKDTVPDLPDPYYEPTLQTDLAMSFMAKQHRQPFCCYLSWGPPHPPLKPPPKFNRYDFREMKPRPNVPEHRRLEVSKKLARYYGLCESLDHEVGRLMKFLDEHNLASQTIVVFTSDHGDTLGSHGRFFKGKADEESLHVPLIMRYPSRLPAGRRSPVLFNSIDVMPTLLSLCGLRAPASCEGQDLSAAAMGRGAQPNVDSIYCQGRMKSSYPQTGEPDRRVRTWRAVVTERYKLSVEKDWNNVRHLFDVQNDPYEMHNLVGCESHRAVQRELMAELRSWAERTGDPFPYLPDSAKPSYTDEEAAAARS